MCPFYCFYNICFVLVESGLLSNEYLRTGLTTDLYILVLVSVLIYLFFINNTIQGAGYSSCFFLFTSDCSILLPVNSALKYLRCISCCMTFPYISNLQHIELYLQLGFYSSHLIECWLSRLVFDNILQLSKFSRLRAGNGLIHESKSTRKFLPQWRFKQVLRYGALYVAIQFLFECWCNLNIYNKSASRYIFHMLSAIWYCRYYWSLRSY